MSAGRKKNDDFEDEPSALEISEPGDEVPVHKVDSGSALSTETDPKVFDIV